MQAKRQQTLGKLLHKAAAILVYATLSAGQTAADGLPDPGMEIAPSRAVLVVTDAAAQLPDWDGYAAALTNFRMIANDIAPTAEAVSAIQAAYR